MEDFGQLGRVDDSVAVRVVLVERAHQHRDFVLAYSIGHYSVLSISPPPVKLLDTLSSILADS